MSELRKEFKGKLDLTFLKPKPTLAPYPPHPLKGKENKKLHRPVTDGFRNFGSVKEAAEYHSISSSTISNCLKGRYKSKYNWQYVLN